MTEQGSQFTCPQCGKPQFTAEFGFERHQHPVGEVKDPCVFCGESTSAGGINKIDRTAKDPIADFVSKIGIMNPKFVNRVPGTWSDPNDSSKTIEGYSCADCLSAPCATCSKQIPLDEEIPDQVGQWHHHGCLNPKDAAEGYQDCECDDCEKWRK